MLIAKTLSNTTYDKTPYFSPDTVPFLNEIFVSLGGFWFDTYVLYISTQRKNRKSFFVQLTMETFQEKVSNWQYMLLVMLLLISDLSFSQLFPYTSLFPMHTCMSMYEQMKQRRFFVQSIDSQTLKLKNLDAQNFNIILTQKT